MRMASVSGFFRFSIISIAATLFALSAGHAFADTAAPANDSPDADQATHSDDPALVTEARELLETIERLGEEHAELKAQGETAEETSGKAVAELQARRRLL